jgi:hypothetical protein
MKLADIVYNPRFSSSIILKSGEYEGENRQKFIFAVSEYDILLAAQCKASSIEKEEQIKNYLIEKAIKTVTKSENNKKIGEALCALVKLKEIELVQTLFFWLGSDVASEVFKTVNQLENAPYQELEDIFEQIYFNSPQNYSKSLELLEFKVDLKYIDNSDVNYELIQTQKQRKFKTELQFESEKHYPLLVKLYKNVEKLGLTYTKEMYHRLINYSPSFSDAKKWFVTMQGNSIIPDEISYNTLINKSETFADAKLFFEEMKTAKLHPNEISYSTLINKSETFADAKLFFEEMKTAKLRPNEISYSTLINKSETFADAKLFFEEMKTANLRPNEISYSTLINKSETFADAKMLFEEMKTAKLRPNEISYSTLINKSETFADAKFFFEEMKTAKLRPNEISYNTLINKSETFADAKLFFEEMKTAKLRLDEISYSTLINKSETFADAKMLFEEMKTAKLRLDEISYSTLINKSETFAQQRPYYEEFLQKFPLRKGNFKSEKNYNYLFFSLFRKVKNKDDFDFVQKEIYRLGLTLDTKYHTRTPSFYKELAEQYK